MQTTLTEAALGNKRKSRVIWLRISTKTTRLRQDNLFRDRDLQQGPIEYKTELITARLVLSVCFAGRKFVKVQFRSRRHFTPGRAGGYFSPPATHMQDRPR
jgi:hypothetical protein